MKDKIMAALFVVLGFGMAGQASANCWWQWQGVSSHYQCDECGSSECSTLSGGGDSGASFETIVLKNDCYQHGAIWAALHYQNLNGQWVTGGFWKLAPGESVTAGSTKNSLFYIYANNADFSTTWAGHDGTWNLFGKPYSFLQITEHWQTWGTHTQRFTCN